MEPNDKMGFPPGVAESMVRIIKLLYLKYTLLFSRLFQFFFILIISYFNIIES